MDVEKLKKINKLSVEFKKHGLSNNEAIKQASQTVRDQDFRDVMEKTSNENEEKASPAFDKQYQIMLERQNRQLAQEIVALKETVAAIQSELRELKQGSVKVAASSSEPKVEKQATLPKKENHPKQGQYSSEDVAVDKIFYYGNK